MTAPVAFSPEAEAQLTDLYRYIAGEASGDTAARYVDDVIGFCESLARFPGRGVPRDDLRPRLRTIAFRRRIVIAYAVKGDAVTVLAVFYGGQDFESAL